MFDIKIRNLVSTIFFFFIIFYFNDSHSIHHHKRFSFNFTQGTEFFWKNRLLIFDHKYYSEYLMDLKAKECEINNRNLKIFFYFSEKYYHFDTKEIEKNLTFKSPFGVSIIGYDGELKFKSEKFVSFKDIILIIDKMPLRTKEKKFDRRC